MDHHGWITDRSESGYLRVIDDLEAKLTAMTADRDRLQAIVDRMTQGVRVDKA